MSIIKVNQVTSVNESDRVSFPTGVNVGIISATGIDVSGVTTTATLRVGSGITASGGNLTLTGSVSASGGFAGDGSQLTNINAYSQGQYNIGISTAVVYDVTTTAGVAYSVSSGVGTLTKYVVHSIHLTNIAASDVTVTGVAYTSEYSLGYQIPMPQRSSMELLRKPKILTAGENIKLTASTNSAIKAIITAEKITDTAGDFFGRGVTCTNENTYYDLYTAPATNAAMIRSLLIANRNETFDTRVTVTLTDSANTILSYFAYDLIIPANSTVELFETDKFVFTGYKIRISATSAAVVDATVSGRRVYTLG